MLVASVGGILAESFKSEDTSVRTAVSTEAKLSLGFAFEKSAAPPEKQAPHQPQPLPQVANHPISISIPSAEPLQSQTSPTVSYLPEKTEGSHTFASKSANHHSARSTRNETVVNEPHMASTKVPTAATVASPTISVPTAPFANPPAENRLTKAEVLPDISSKANLGNLVFFDFNDDGIRQPNGTDNIPGNQDDEAGVAGVTLILCDATGQPVDNPNLVDFQFYTATTDNLGSYNFVELNPGSYTVKISNPPPAKPKSSSVTFSQDDGQDDDNNGSQIVSGGPIGSPVIVLTAGETDNTLDFGLSVPPKATLGNLVFLDINNDGHRDEDEPGIANVELTLYGSNGFPVDDPNKENLQNYTTATDETGHYAFTNLDAGEYFITISIPPSNSPSSSAYTDFLDNQVDDNDNGFQFFPGAEIASLTINLSEGETDLTVDFGLATLVPQTFEAWQNAHPLNGFNRELDDPDADDYNNFLEYIACTNPMSGAQPYNPFEIVIGPGGRIDLRFRHTTGLTDVEFLLEAAAELPPTGSPEFTPVNLFAPTIEDNQDGTTTEIYSDLGSNANLFETKSAFFRMSAFKSSPIGPMSMGSFPIIGCTQLTHPGDLVVENAPLVKQTTTFSMPYLKRGVISGIVDDNTEFEIALNGSLGGTSLKTVLNPTLQYYIELVGGPLEGHRFDVDHGTTTDVNLGIAPHPRNTISLNGISIGGSQFVIREHHTLDSIFPPAEFTAGDSSSNSDNVYTFENGTWTVYWLLAIPTGNRWINDVDPLLLDKGQTIIYPDQGVFARHRGEDLLLPKAGILRANKFITPLAQGYTLVGSGFPMAQSYASRHMTIPNGFHGSLEVSASDQILHWRGDSIQGATSYDTSWLLDGGEPYQFWTSAANSDLSDISSELLLSGFGAVIHKCTAANPTFTVPAQWGIAVPQS